MTFLWVSKLRIVKIVTAREDQNRLVDFPHRSSLVRSSSSSDEMREGQPDSEISESGAHRPKTPLGEPSPVDVYHLKVGGGPLAPNCDYHGLSSFQLGVNYPMDTGES